MNHRIPVPGYKGVEHPPRYSSGFFTYVVNVNAPVKLTVNKDSKIFNIAGRFKCSVVGQLIGRESVIEREILEYKNDRDKVGACLKSIEKKSDELQVKIEKMDTLLKNVCRTLGGEDNVLSSTTRPGPNWGSAVLSRENTPIPPVITLDTARKENEANTLQTMCGNQCENKFISSC